MKVPQPTPLTLWLAYHHALAAWGQVLAPLAALNRDKVNPKDRRFQGADWETPRI